MQALFAKKYLICAYARHCAARRYITFDAMASCCGVLFARARPRAHVRTRATIQTRAHVRTRARAHTRVYPRARPGVGLCITRTLRHPAAWPALFLACTGIYLGERKSQTQKCPLANAKGHTGCIHKPYEKGKCCG